MSRSKLLDVIGNLDRYDPALTVYVTKPWSCDSEAVVAREPQRGGVPSEAESCGAVYFVEVFVVKELLEGWIALESRPLSAREQCERVIHYALYDA